MLWQLLADVALSTEVYKKRSLQIVGDIKVWFLNQWTEGLTTIVGG
jgi:hypothetical protein